MTDLLHGPTSSPASARDDGAASPDGFRAPDAAASVETRTVPPSTDDAVDQHGSIDGGASVEADPPSVTLLRALPPEVAGAGYLPFAFGVTGPAPRDDVSTYRTAASEAYRASVFVCWPSPRPITRCFKVEP